jgi:DNA replication and repair protein RecF
VDSTFDVWDERLAGSGTRLVEAREGLVEQLVGPAGAAYRRLAGRESHLGLAYNRSWEGELRDALRVGRSDDLRHQATGRGPHRDELFITLDDMPARTHASQGEQRCLALALRLAAHELATTKFGEAPILLLDDVFSELDDKRAALLAELLPPGQVLLATAVDPPPALTGSVVDIAEVRVKAGGESAGGRL